MGTAEQCKAGSAKGSNSRKMPGAAGSRITEKTVSHYVVLRKNFTALYILVEEEEGEQGVDW